MVLKKAKGSSFCDAKLKLFMNMEIKKIIQNGEKLSEKSMSDICGGSDMMANVNDSVITCSCTGTGDNNNKGLWCSCKDDGSSQKDETIEENPGTNPIN